MTFSCTFSTFVITILDLMSYSISPIFRKKKKKKREEFGSDTKWMVRTNLGFGEVLF